MNRFINYAHRGASDYAPENTMSAFRKAIELKANGIELDLQKTKDGKIVIFHDDFIDKKSNGIGTISDYTYNELLKFDFGSWFDLKYKDEKIVLFEEFAKKFLSEDLTFAIELKTIGIEKQTLEIIDKYSKSKENIYITSFIFEALENVRKFDKDIKISWLIDEEINQNNIDKLLSIKGSQICPKADKVSNSSIELANRNRLDVRLWGIRDEEIMQKVYKLNIEGMTVNFPDKLKVLIEGE
jgi:glycerophosphoryl diester phosphodiesterase